MSRFLILIILLSIIILYGGAQDSDTLHISVNARVMVFDQFEASNKLADWAENNGGYFTWKSEDTVRIRVPDEKTVAFRDYLEDQSEVVLEYNQLTRDLREDLMQSRSALEAREEVLVKNLSYLNSSDVEGTLELEREIRRLMTEVDNYRGMLRRMEHDRKMAVIQVSLSFEQQTIPDSRPSNFAWINGMDFYWFMNSSMASRRGPDLGSTSITLPDGFALISKSPVLLAISPEGVRLRVKQVKNYPEQTADFWMKTLESNLVSRGYARIDIDTGSDWGGDGLFESGLWAMPWGDEDYLYLTALRLRGGKLELLELAGKAEYVLSYLE